MNIQEIVGIDISKRTLDVFLYKKQVGNTFLNDLAGFKKLSNWIKNNLVNIDSAVFCFEKTGNYSIPLTEFLEKNSLAYRIISDLDLFRSGGFLRGKSDVLDSQRIAKYAWFRREEMSYFPRPGRTMSILAKLITLRSFYVKQRKSAKNLREAFLHADAFGKSNAVDLVECEIRRLNSMVLKMEKRIKVHIKSDRVVHKNLQLLQTITGIGLVLSCELIVHTNNFTKFETWRQFACYCGSAPFVYQSGTSLGGNSKVHPIADKKIKALLTTAAILASIHDPELKDYYDRRIASGKHHMSVINAIRCKLISRSFAVIRRQQALIQLFPTHGNIHKETIAAISKSSQ